VEMIETNGKADVLGKHGQPVSGGTQVQALPDALPLAEESDAVSHELDSILKSSFFRSSKRSQQFLTYVVRYRLAGNLDPLKERIIGTDLFNRPAGYATGDDSVVRVQAGEVRRRLEQYYHANPSDSVVRIELPLGSYAPEFHWTADAASQIGPAAIIIPDSSAIAQDKDPLVPASGKINVTGRLRKNKKLATLFLAVLVLLIVVGVLVHRARAPKSVLDQFWGPMFSTSKPLLICLPKPISYRPSIALYNRYAKTPGEFDSEVDRMNGRPNLKPDDKLVWSDMIEYPDLGVGKGDVEAAIRLSGMLGRLGKDSEVRIGDDYSFEDLRNSPAIIVGAFSNRWTIQTTSGLHFAFAEDRGVFRIQEQGASGRSWYAKLGRNGAIVEDYGIVTRLVTSGTGQFVVAIAGITSDGSEAAAEFASNSEALERALRNSSPDWEQKNVQILVKTTVTDSVTGPPEVVDIYIW